MLFPKQFWPGLADGSVTVAFRRWKRPTVKAGGTLRTPAGMLAIESVERLRLADITVEQARAAGYPTKRAVLDALARHEGVLYKIVFSAAGADPREALRNSTQFEQSELQELAAALARSDERAGQPWTRRTLEVIRDHPGLRAADIAPQFRLELQDFKRRVRRLKALGLTESLEVGYRLSPRGRAFMRTR